MKSQQEKKSERMRGRGGERERKGVEGERKRESEGEKVHSRPVLSSFLSHRPVKSSSEMNLTTLLMDSESDSRGLETHTSDVFQFADFSTSSTRMVHF